ASMSASVGAVLIAKVEDPAKDRTHGAQRVEFAPLHLLEQSCELGVVGDGRLEVPARARGGNGEHLRGDVAPAALLEPARVAVRLDRLPELGDAGAVERVREDDGRLDQLARPE